MSLHEATSDMAITSYEPFKEEIMGAPLQKPQSKKMATTSTSTMVEASLPPKESAPGMCPMCSSNELVLDRDFIYCNKCRTLLNTYMSDTMEPHTDRDKEDDTFMDRYTVAISQIMPESSMKIYIAHLTNKSNYMIKLFEKWNGVPYKERAAIGVYNYILDKTKGKLEKRIVQEAVKIYRSVNDMSISRGPIRYGVIVACVYFACRNVGIPRTHNDLENLFGIEKRLISEGCNKISKLIINEEENPAGPSTPLGKIKNLVDERPLTVLEYMPRIYTVFDLSKDRKALLLAAIEKIKDMPIVKKNTPQSIIAGTILVLSKRHKWGISMKTIAEKSYISESTVAKYNRLLEKII